MKKAILFGLLTWLIIFVEVSIIGFTPGLASIGEHGFTLLPMGIGIHFALVAVFALILAKLFFRKSGAAPKDSLTTAAIIAVTGLALDALITVPFFVKSYGVYFSKWTLWAGIAIFVTMFWVVGKKVESNK